MNEAKKSILVVDDESDTLELLRLILEKEGYSVREARNGKEALEGVQDRPDLVLLDVRMPKMSGLEFCKHVKEDNHYKQIPIILLSALARKEHIEQGLKVGAEEYLTKPFSRGKLIQLIKQYI